jgi:hypothetical protein
MKLTMVLPAAVDIPAAQVQIAGAVLAGLDAPLGADGMSDGRSAPATPCGAGITRLYLQSPGKSAWNRGPQRRGTRAGKRLNERIDVASDFCCEIPFRKRRKSDGREGQQSSPDG